ncbi:MAG: hypothetical protein A2W05_05360 [Candidatus Schekmanbacteria bacterium RBG_16_38_10]|uniref:WbqC-like protein n=1 Tax=Candidatus Schekmanbacteria bacterium RBG_16_38_10 TaxID=1817879 RepID=A0A1F7RZF2_9BACT|nr:MAG: hypothetical protein A2W05_05360 [Candidatus Schekmanbacteria bacterium RBG_16_38_10]
MKRVAILQSNYIPWKGYFDIIHDVDLFIFYDDVQFTKNDWRNRNKIKGISGTQWLSIPVGTNLNRLICEVEIKDRFWQKNHWKTIMQFYQNAPYFSLYKDFFQHVYLGQEWNNLSELNQFMITHISTEFLGIKAEFKDSREYRVTGERLDRLITLLQNTKADTYISGPSARNYIAENRFHEERIKLIYKDYGNYLEYPQLYPPFYHNVSIIDLLFNTGSNAPYYIWGWRDTSR